MVWEKHKTSVYDRAWYSNTRNSLNIKQSCFILKNDTSLKNKENQMEKKSIFIVSLLFFLNLLSQTHIAWAVTSEAPQGQPATPAGDRAGGGDRGEKKKKEQVQEKKTLEEKKSDRQKSEEHKEQKKEKKEKSKARKKEKQDKKARQNQQKKARAKERTEHRKVQKNKKKGKI